MDKHMKIEDFQEDIDKKNYDKVYKQIVEQTMKLLKQIAKKFKQQGYVKYVINTKNLGKVIKSMENFIPKQYKKSESNIISIIENYIDNN